MPKRQDMTGGYNGNPNLPLPEENVAFSAEELAEYVKCSQDPIHFITNYVKIVNVDDGIIKFEMWDFQKNIVRTFNENRFVICKLARQTGKSTVVVCGYFLWYVLFHADVSVGILANKEETAIMLLDRWKQSFELLPRFLKQGVVKWDQKVIKLANNARIRAAATSASAIRGDTFNILFLDEFAFVEENIALNFITSVFPTISSGKTTKLFIVSTPNGYNLFYKIWNDAVEKNNSYVPIAYNWRDVPGRDDKWAEEQRRNMGSEQKFQQEYECDFMGSANTLVAPWKLNQLSYSQAIEAKLDDKGNGLKIYKRPIRANDEGPGHIYLICNDVGQGQEQDYSVCQVIDISTTPFEQVAIYRSNLIKPTQFARVIQDLGRHYNNAFLFFETNAEGGPVAELLVDEFEYENVIYVWMHPKRGQQISGGYHKRSRFGLRMVETTKRTGCTGLKTLIENDKLRICDYETMRELTTFVAKMSKNGSHAKTYEAEVGNHDDCVMPLVLLGWLTLQQGFENYVGLSMRQLLTEGHDTLTFDAPPIGILGDLEQTASQPSVGGFDVVDDPGFWRDTPVSGDDKNWLN